MINCSTAVFKSAYVSHELPVKADERIFILFEMEHIAKYKQKVRDSHKLCWAKNVHFFSFFMKALLPIDVQSLQWGGT